MPTAVKHPMPLVGHWWMLTVRGVAAIVFAFGALALAWPGITALALLYVFGAVLVGLSLRLRAWGRQTQRPLPTGGLPATT